MEEVDGRAGETRVGAARPRGRGGRRPGFDRAAALDAALRLFWERGYEGTSFDELTAAMGLSPSSFYNSFGSKERLFLEAADTYQARASARIDAALGGDLPTRDAFGRLLEGAAAAFTEADTPRGCFVLGGGCSQVGPSALALRDRMAALRGLVERRMEARIRRGIADGDVPAGIDAAALAGLMAAVLRGMAMQARDGATGPALAAIARAALAAWPGVAGRELIADAGGTM